MANRQGEAYWKAHHDAWKQSGQTQIGYCTHHGINNKTFGRWRRQLEASQNTEPPLTLVPIRLNHSANLGNIQIYSPGGWRIEIPKHDSQSLAEILRRLP